MPSFSPDEAPTSPHSCLGGHQGGTGHHVSRLCLVTHPIQVSKEPDSRSHLFLIYSDASGILKGELSV